MSKFVRTIRERLKNEIESRISKENVDSVKNQDFRILDLVPTQYVERSIEKYSSSDIHKGNFAV